MTPDSATGPTRAMLSRFSTILALVSAILALASTVSAQQSVRYVRFTHEGRTAWGVLDGETIRELAEAPYVSTRETGRRVARNDARLLAPVEPSKIIAAGLNYRSHLGNRPVPPYPGLFAKYPTSIIGPDDAILLPGDAGNVHYEGELVVVIARTARNVPVGEAASYVFGVTAGNDISERDWQSSDLQWLRAKASDGFAPIGPVLVTDLNFEDLLVQTRVNGEVRQTERSSDLIFSVAELVSYVSRYITLLPGDVLFTGTPQTTRAIQPGDIVEIEVEHVGILRNRVERKGEGDGELRVGVGGRGSGRVRVSKQLASWLFHPS